MNPQTVAMFVAMAKTAAMFVVCVAGGWLLTCVLLFPICAIQAWWRERNDPNWQAAKKMRRRSPFTRQQLRQAKRDLRARNRHPFFRRRPWWRRLFDRWRR